MREEQRPQALVITCADSRVHPDVLTQSAPGEIFVTRNIGNMVPAYGEMMGGVSAVLEYAVSALKVKHLVVCGHTDCGAMKALLDPESVASDAHREELAAQCAYGVERHRRPGWLGEW